MYCLLLKTQIETHVYDSFRRIRILNAMNMIIFSLKVRQQQWKEEEAIRIANMPDPSVPPGHTLMPREERLQTLASLQKSKLHKFLLTSVGALYIVFGSDNNKM